MDQNQSLLLRPLPGDDRGAITQGLVKTKDFQTGMPDVCVYRLQRQFAKTMTVMGRVSEEQPDIFVKKLQ